MQVNSLLCEDAEFTLHCITGYCICHIPNGESVVRGSLVLGRISRPTLLTVACLGFMQGVGAWSQSVWGTEASQWGPGARSLGSGASRI